MQATDLQLLMQLAQEDEKALELLYRRYKAQVYNTALSYLQQAEVAEEITQDVFIQIYRSAANFQEQASVSTWIYRICVNKSIDQLRYQKRKKRFVKLVSLTNKEASLPESPDFIHPGVLLEQRENAQYLFKVIKELSESQQTAFILSYVEGLPQQEVALVMELSVKAVESLLQRAKKNLRKKLEKHYPGRRKS